MKAVPQASVESSSNAYVNASYWELLHGAHTGNISAVGYPELGEGFNRATYKMRLDAVARILTRNGACPVRDILEAGVGIGAYAQLWERAGVGLWKALDISRTAVECVAQRYPSCRCYVADLTDRAATDFVLQQDTFNLVTAIDVLYHIVPDVSVAAALGTLASRIKPGGHLLVSDVFCTEDCHEAPHVKRRSLATFKRMLEPYDVRLIDRESVFGLFGYCAPRSNGRPVDSLLFTGWRAAAKVIRLSSPGARNTVGTLMVYALRPLDALLRRCNVAKGRNLELALFQKAGRP